jgi:hypothetical protein
MVLQLQILVKDVELRCAGRLVLLCNLLAAVEKIWECVACMQTCTFHRDVNLLVQGFPSQ